MSVCAPIHLIVSIPYFNIDEDEIEYLLRVSLSMRSMQYTFGWLPAFNAQCDYFLFDNRNEPNIHLYDMIWLCLFLFSSIFRFFFSILLLFHFVFGCGLCALPVFVHLNVKTFLCFERIQIENHDTDTFREKERNESKKKL